MQEAVLLLVLLDTMSGRALHLIHLPATGNVAENSSPETSVHKFSVQLSALLSPVIPGYPLIINSSPLTDAFRVNWLSGTDFEVVTTGKEQLDFETGPNIFDLQIYVKDGVGVTDLQILTVQVTDVNEPPQFLGNLAKGLDLYIVEEANPGFSYQVEVFNPEDTSRNTPLSYFLISSLKSFIISANGTLFSTTEFDFEAGSLYYHLIVKVRDSQELRASTSLWVNIVSINDETPHFTSQTRVYVILEELGPGAIMGNITAEDPDDKGFTSFLLYSITIVNSYFRINLTGTIQVARRLDDAGELRQNPVISLEVLVKDRPFGGQENRMQITFVVKDINDNPATCTKFTFSSMVPEREAKGTLLLDLNTVCFDNDSEAPNSQSNFTIQTPSGVRSHGRFLRDPAGSGTIVLVGDLDYENPNNLAAGNKYLVIIQVQDVACLYYKSKYHFDLFHEESSLNNIYMYVLISPENEFPLVFDQLSVFDVSEISPARALVGWVQATDKDFRKSSTVYSISTGGASPYPNVFWINPKTGELQLVTKVDYETTRIYILRIQATNKEDTNVTVTVNILEENDKKPICIPNSYFMAIPVDLKVGTNVQNFKLMCTDRDSSPRSFRCSIGLGNVDSHFTFPPNAGSNVTCLLLDYTGGLDKIWDYRLLVYITDVNLLSGRRKAEVLIETGTVTLSISVIPPTTIITKTPRPQITYQILRKNVYFPSAWHAFVVTLGSILLLVLLAILIVQLAKAIHRYCSGKIGKHEKPLVKKGEMKNTKREVVVETIQMNTVFDGEALDPVAGAKYVFNLETGARKWKDPLKQMSKWKEPSHQDAPSRAVSVGGTRPQRSIQEGDGLSDKAQAEDTASGSRNQDGKPGTPKNRDQHLKSRISPKPPPGK
ncbi:LOW QUALITY PROTEIN: cadherin-related family member 3 [Molossus nigricans]